MGASGNSAGHHASGCQVAAYVPCRRSGVAHCQRPGARDGQPGSTAHLDNVLPAAGRDIRSAGRPSSLTSRRYRSGPANSLLALLYSTTEADIAEPDDSTHAEDLNAESE